jgi:hypothetical protein
MLVTNIDIKDLSKFIEKHKINECDLRVYDISIKYNGIYLNIAHNSFIHKVVLYNTGKCIDNMSDKLFCKILRDAIIYPYIKRVHAIKMILND